MPRRRLIEVPVLQVHGVLANSVVLYLLLVGLWGLRGYLRHYGVSRNYLGALAIGEAVLLLQALVGAVLLFMGRVPREELHYLYGVGSALGLPLAYSYLRGREDRRALLVYSLTTLFVFGLAVRAITTAL